MPAKTNTTAIGKNPKLNKIYERVLQKDAGEPEFHQAVREFLESIEPTMEKNPSFEKNMILERLIEPERQIAFRVTWMDDSGNVRVNRGYRVQFNSALGPFKGGLRFHPSVYIGIMKFLGFEQIFKNSLTGLNMGGAKGGSDFDPKGKSDMEVMRFCQAFMGELVKYVGPNTDVPAGDIGVGGREIGYLYGAYRRIMNRFEGVLTGKALEIGGSLIRPEATGYGATYFLWEMLKTKKEDMKGKVVGISGSGNVAQYAIEKVNQLGGKVVTASDSDGYIYDPEGIMGKKFDALLAIKQQERGRIKDYADQFNCKYVAGKRPWAEKMDIAMPCATQNEIDVNDATNLVNSKCIAVVEGANMPTTLDATKVLIDAGVMFAPGKAANAGGVATSGLEMAQNFTFQHWTKEDVDAKLHQIMIDIHASAYKAAKDYGKPGNYMVGANIAGFLRVASAMNIQGIP